MGDVPVKTNRTVYCYDTLWETLRRRLRDEGVTVSALLEELAVADWGPMGGVLAGARDRAHASASRAPERLQGPGGDG